MPSEGPRKKDLGCLSGRGPSPHNLTRHMAKTVNVMSKCHEYSGDWTPEPGSPAAERGPHAWNQETAYRIADWVVAILARASLISTPNIDLTKSGRGVREVTATRQLVWYILHVHHAMTVMRLGELFKRDHGTVCYGIAAMRGRMGLPGHDARMACAVFDEMKITPVDPIAGWSKVAA